MVAADAALHPPLLPGLPHPAGLDGKAVIGGELGVAPMEHGGQTHRMDAVVGHELWLGHVREGTAERNPIRTTRVR